MKCYIFNTSKYRNNFRSRLELENATIYLGVIFVDKKAHYMHEKIRGKDLERDPLGVIQFRNKSQPFVFTQIFNFERDSPEKIINMGK